MPQASGRVSDHQEEVSPLVDMELEIAALYTSHAPGLLRYALTLMDDTSAAQDALQEIFLRYFVARSEGRHFGNPKAWLFRVLRNHLLDILKSSARKNEIAIEGLGHSPDRWNDPEKHYHRAEIERELTRLLAPRELECVWLRAEGFSYGEIAGILDLRQGTVGATLARAHKKVRRFLAAADELKERMRPRSCITDREENSYSS